MTTEATETIAEKATRYRDLKAALDSGYAELKALEYELITDLRAEYPDEYDRWQRGVASLKAHGLSLEVKRTYDPDKVTAEFGEEVPDLTTTETKVVTKVDGRKAAAMWKDAALARRLESCIVPQAPRIKVTE